MCLPSTTRGRRKSEMKEFIRLTAATLLAAILFCSCGEVKIESITLSKNAAELKEGGERNAFRRCRAGERNGELRLEIRG